MKKRYHIALELSGIHHMQMLDSFDGNWVTCVDAHKIGKRMLEICNDSPRSHHCFWLGIVDRRKQKMHRAFILGLPVMNMAKTRIIGVEMRIVHKASIQLSESPSLFKIVGTSDVYVVAQWMVLFLVNSNDNMILRRSNSRQ